MGVQGSTAARAGNPEVWIKISMSQGDIWQLQGHSGEVKRSVRFCNSSANEIDFLEWLGSQKKHVFNGEK